MTPEEADAAFADAIRRGDIDGAVALFDDEGVFVEPTTGLPISGADAIRDAIARVAQGAGSLEADPPQVVIAGDVALVVSGWRLGEAAGTATDVLRRQPDGGWRYLIVNPAGGQLPEPTGA